MSQGNKNLLNKNFNEWDIFSIINNTKVNGNQVIGWKIIAGKKITIDVSFYIIRKFRNEIVVRVVNTKESSKLGDLATGSDKINFYLPEDLVLFQTEVKQIETNGDLRIKIPSMIAQIDRRKDIRLNLKEGVCAKVFFQKENILATSTTKLHSFKKDCFDLSGGGLSFLVSKSEMKFFKRDDIIENITLNLGNEEFKLSSYVVNILEQEPDSRNGLNYKAWKICVKYREITEKEKKKIDQFVFQYVDFDDAI